MQCITHFLQLPIEDEFLADLAPAAQPGRPIAEEGAGRNRAGDSSAPPEAAAELIPFADAGNPVMAQARRAPAPLLALFDVPVYGVQLRSGAATAVAELSPLVISKRL